MLISVGAAVLGFLLAWTLYFRRPQLPARIAASLGGLYQAVAHKYYIDELYASCSSSRWSTARPRSSGMAWTRE